MKDFKKIWSKEGTQNADLQKCQCSEKFWLSKTCSLSPRYLTEELRLVNSRKYDFMSWYIWNIHSADIHGMAIYSPHIKKIYESNIKKSTKDKHTHTTPKTLYVCVCVFIHVYIVYKDSNVPTKPG